MKKDIHPKYYETKVTCGCGANYTIGSTIEEIRVEICSACHPFYTGTAKLIDTAGRVDRFKSRLQKKSDVAVDVKETKKIKEDSSTELEVKEKA